MSITSPQRILVATSGGVDSAVAALLLKRAGHEVVCAYMKNWINEEGIRGECPWQQDIEDARACADHLGLPFRVINLMRDYREKVVQYLIDGYKAGETPNPDTMCNREIKFGIFREVASREGFSAVATGHYALIETAGSSPVLREGIDPDKDQSYFLAMVRASDLKTVRFPIGHLHKKQVRDLAVQAGLPNARKKDSQGICFVGQVRMQDFLRYFVPDDPGEIYDVTRDRVLGRHRGLHFFTIGQRRGIGIPSNRDFEKYVVVGKDSSTRRLLVSFESEQAGELIRNDVTIHSINWLGEAPSHPLDVEVRVRYRDPKIPALLSPLAHGRAHLQFASGQRALAPGQVAALYHGSLLLGGGYFEPASCHHH